MTLTYQEWALQVENVDQGWSYATFPGDLAPPPGPVWIHADDFSLEWAFENELSPALLEPAVFQFSLTCADAADVPDIAYGDELRVALTRPDGTTLVRNPGTGVVTGDYGADLVPERSFWVTDISAIEAEANRMRVNITATGAIADVTLDVRQALNAYGESTGQTFADWAAFANWIGAGDPTMPEALKACVYLTDGPNYGNPGPWHVLDSGATVDGWRGCMLKIGETISLKDLLDQSQAFALAPAGAQGRAHGFALIWEAGQSPVPGKSIIHDIWDPESSAPHEAAWELTYVASVLDAALRSGFTPAADGSTLGIVSACMIEAAPNWRKDAIGSVGTAEYKGVARIAGSPATDADATITSTDGSGPAVRSIDSELAYLRNTVEPTLDFDTYGGRRTADACFLADAPAGNGWVPESFRVLPRYMTDAEYEVLGPLFWPVDERQRTLVLVELDPDADMAAGRPVWMTLVGCKFTIEDGHLVMEPASRPFVPVAVNDVTDSVTWTELNTAYPAAKWSQVADGLTWAQLKLTSI